MIMGWNRVRKTKVKKRITKHEDSKVSLRKKENMEKLRLAYDPSYCFDRFFKEVMNSVEVR